MKELTEPNDLLHCFYKYGLHEVPISRDGEITGKLVKNDVVRYLNRSEQFESNIVTTIDNLVEPVEPDFFDQLKDQLQSGEIKGIPVIRENGDLKQVVTPGVLDARQEAHEYIDESRKRELYEDLLEAFPFPLALFRDGEPIYENRRYREIEDSETTTVREWCRDELTLKLLLPGMVDDLIEADDALRSDQTVDLRELLDGIERRLMEVAHERADSTSEAAEKVELPRQTFNYRWKKYQSGDGEND